MALPPTAASTNSPASFSVSPCTITLGCSSMPTDTRKMGTNTAAPKKSIRSISGPSLGTSRLSPSPAKKAPTSPSMPRLPAKVAAPRNEAMASR